MSRFVFTLVKPLMLIFQARVSRNQIKPFSAAAPQDGKANTAKRESIVAAITLARITVFANRYHSATFATVSTGASLVANANWLPSE